MQSSRKSLSRLLYLVCAMLLFGAGQAHARKRGLMIISTGSTHSELGPVKKENISKLDVNERLEVETSHYDTVGYQYSHFGIFWLDIWNWGGEYIVYNKVSENGGIVTPAKAAMLMGVEEGKLGKPLNYRMPFGLMIILGLVSLKFVPRILAKRRQSREVPQYQPSGGGRQQWSPQNPPPGAPGYPAPPRAGGPPPMPPPMPPDQ